MLCEFVCSYLAVMVEFETYYGSAPHKPLWVRSFHDEMAKMKLKKLPMADTNLHEQFRKYFGYKKALKYKVGSCGLKKIKSLLLLFVCFVCYFVSLYGFW